MGALMRSYDWRRTELGDPADWPATLKSAIATILSSRFPMVVWWGPRLLMLYNDAWQPILGDTKHPAGLGRPGEESWPETWPVVGAQFERALGGIASWSEDLLLASDRHGFLEESYFTYSHGPLRDGAGTVVGVFSVVSESTARVLNDRRLGTLARMSTVTVDATRRSEPLAALCQLLLETLCRANPDAPFAVQYLAASPQRLHRVAAAGIDAARLPASVDSTAQDAWGIADALRSLSTVARNRPAPDQLPGGVWPEPTTDFLVLPLFQPSDGTDLSGILLVGLNARLRLDAPYAEFLRLVAAQLGSAISTLQAVNREREARDEAQRAARLRDEFLATLSHELRNPLNAIIGWTQILKNAAAQPDLVANAVEVIERNARLQAQVVTDLLDISRAISGNLRLDVQDVDIAQAVAASIQSLAPAAIAKGITLTTNIDPINRSVRGDPARIDQMLWNLLSNALKFTAERGQVDVSTGVDGPYLSIRVADDGDGIDPAFMPQLFQRFRQADASHAPEHKGLGLGLAIVKQFAELQGGRVSATSDGVGRGATFVLQLPRAGTGRAAATTASPSIAAAPVVDKIDLAGVRVLLVEDEPDALKMVTRILADASARVTPVASAESALEILAGARFDAIVSDIAMPGLDGYDLVAELRARGIDTPTIALTAFALPDDVSKAIETGFSAHIAKPVERASLLATVWRLTRQDH